MTKLFAKITWNSLASRSLNPVNDPAPFSVSLMDRTSNFTFQLKPRTSRAAGIAVTCSATTHCSPIPSGQSSHSALPSQRIQKRLLLMLNLSIDQTQ
jgi:hypothetical protein